MSVAQQEAVNADAVLAKAVVNAATQLGLKQAEVARAIGIHRSAFSRLKQKPVLSPQSKPGELALIIIRLARALYALTGGDETWMRRFMRQHNTMTGGIPAEQIGQIEGLMTVLRFVDAIRGKV